MNHLTIAYLIYLAVTVPLVVYVARTLFRHGGIFLREVFHGNEPLAGAVNQLLVVGFYLLNLGYVALFLRADQLVDSGEEVLEMVARKVGIVSIVLGVVHLANVWIFNTLRKNAVYQQQTELPVATDEWTEVVDA